MKLVRDNLQRCRTLALHAKELIRPSGPPGIVIAHHKCASVWVWSIVKNGCRGRSIPARRVQYPPPPPWTTGCYIRASRAVMVMDPTWGLPMEVYTRIRPIHITRDPRGVLASMLESHRSSHPLERRSHDPLGEIARNREVLPKLNDADGYRWLFEQSEHLENVVSEMVRIQRFANPRDRIDHKDIAEDPLDAIRRLVVPLGVPENDVEPLAEKFAFGRLKRDGGHYRRGDPDSWREELPTDVLEKFQDRWGGELEMLGYPAWT